MSPCPQVNDIQATVEGNTTTFSFMELSNRVFITKDYNLAL